MVKFLLQRPIAVLMAFTACFILGLVTYFTIPVSLLPNIAIPEITVQVSGPNTSARELENTVVKTIRQQLMQVTRLKDIQSETYDGAAIVRLYFDFGTDTDLAFIEVNEKIDATMNYLPKTVERPRVVKASATDIPVFYLNLTLKDDNRQDIHSFIELCDFAGSVIKRRIEQLPEVAMADITGIVKRQVQVVPDMSLLEIADISLTELEKALTDNNIEPGSMQVRDGHYEYNIRFSSFLRTVEDVKNIYLRKNNRIYQLKQLAHIEEVPEQERGLSLSNGKRAVSLAVVKQADENMDDMKASLQEVMEHFTQVYPDIDFRISRSQTELLDYTISNLKQNFLLAFLLIFITALLFMGDIKSPFVIGISMIVSLVISILFFYLFHVSLNIISLSGLILALGMMIDNSIIVTENIVQYRQRGLSLQEACDQGTSEVITPMLSSAFTTIAVFVPLVFMSGIAGAIFFDQAFAVTVGLLVSYVTAIMLLPVLYKLIYSLPDSKKWINLTFKNPVNPQRLDYYYHWGVNFIFRHKTGAAALVLLAIPLCILLFYQIPKSRMPEVKEYELMVHLEWNENIHIEENRQRVERLFSEVAAQTIEYTGYIGQQQYLLKRDQELSVSEAELYFKTSSPEQVTPLQEAITRWLHTAYPLAIYSFSPPETIFEKLFVTGEADIIAGLAPYHRAATPESYSIKEMENRLTAATGYRPAGIAFDKQLNIHIDHEKLLLYQVDYNEVYRILKTAFKENEVTTLRSYQQYLPVLLAGNEQPVQEIIHSTLVPTIADEKGEIRQIPLSALLRVTQGEDLKSITAGKNGEYIPFRFYEVDKEEKLIEQIKKQTGSDWEVSFSGSFFSNKQMINELVVILFISILLMYFILAAQFESFLQPFIVILEIPIDVAAALLILWICGHTLNLMSAIGIVVTCGIIINDSILKLDAINELRKGGTPLIEAIHEAGRRRLRPILMTSLTTIFAMVPLLFTSDLGSELQKPLAIAMIAAMVIGTLVSLFIIPLIYWFIYRKEKTEKRIITSD